MRDSQQVTRPVRARTRPGRLAAVDAWLTASEPALIRPGARVVDFGFGETPVTTLEWAQTLPDEVTVVAVEQDAGRVEAARETAAGRLQLVHGGFEALAALAPVTVVRAMNVLRAYPADQIDAAHAALGAPVCDRGIVIEGSTDTAGDVTVAYVLRKHGMALVREALLFHTTFARGFSPWLFRDSLPRDLRRSVKPGSAIFAFLSTWHAAFEATSGPIETRFAHSVIALPAATSWGAGALRWALQHAHGTDEEVRLRSEIR